MGFKGISKATPLVIFLCVASVAQGQGCSAVLSGIYDFNSRLDTGQNFSNFASWLCKNKETASQESLDINVFEFGSADGRGSRSTVDQMCSEKKVTRSVFRRVVEASATANVNVVDAWSRCMARRGFKFGIQQGSDPKRFSVVMNYISISPNITEAEILNGSLGFGVSSDTNVTCETAWMQATDRVVPQQRTVTCVRDDPEQPVTITINSDPSPEDNGGSLEVAGYFPVSIVPDPPVPTERDKIVAALEDRRTCRVTYSSTARTGVGTIRRGTAYPFEVTWNGSQWVVTGFHPSNGGKQSHSYAGNPPRSNTYSHWGTIFVIRDNGNVYSRQFPDFGGKMACE